MKEESFMGVSRSIRKQEKNKREKDGKIKTAAPRKQRSMGSEASESSARRGSLTGLILVIVFIVGLSVTLYPSVSAYVNEKHASRAIVDYEAFLKNMKKEDYTAFYAAADAYNAKLPEIDFPFMYYSRAQSCLASDADPDVKPPPVPEAGEYRVTAADGLPVRKKPAINAETLAVMPEGTVFTAAETKGAWGKVKYDGKTGWCCLNEYMGNVNPDGSGLMGYISIDKIKVELPVLHNITPGVLNRSAGHMPGSSLPVGGTNTHCVLLAHRGLPSATLFTYLDRLEPGDTFRLTVLDRVLTYEVDQIRIVEPANLEDLYIVPGGDFCTLVTCTPYGINTHRLLVRGKRIETVLPKPEVYVPNEAFIIDPIIVAPVVALPILFVLLIVLMIKYNKHRRVPPEGAELDEIAEALGLRGGFTPLPDEENAEKSKKTRKAKKKEKPENETGG